MRNNSRSHELSFYVLEVTDKQRNLTNFYYSFLQKVWSSLIGSIRKQAEFRIFQQALEALERVIRSETELHQFFVLRQKLNELRKNSNHTHR